MKRFQILSTEKFKTCMSVQLNIICLVFITHNRLTAFDLGLPGYAGTRRNIYPLTPILIIGTLYQLPPFTTIHSILFVQFACLTVFFNNLSLGPLGLDPLLHTPCISSANRHLFAAHARPIAAYSAVIPMLSSIPRA